MEFKNHIAGLQIILSLTLLCMVRALWHYRANSTTSSKSCVVWYQVLIWTNWRGVSARWSVLCLQCGGDRISKWEIDTNSFFWRRGKSSLSRKCNPTWSRRGAPLASWSLRTFESRQKRSVVDALDVCTSLRAHAHKLERFSSGWRSWGGEAGRWGFNDTG